MSEPGITSDKMKRGSRNFVRTWYHFRQNQERNPKYCPNLVSLQTKTGAEPRILSEPGITSDKIRSGTPSIVRTRHYFRQNQERNPKYCPNPSSLQTKSGVEPQVLSESGITSDKIKSGTPSIVRTRHHFRQNQERNPK